YARSRFASPSRSDGGKLAAQAAPDNSDETVMFFRQLPRIGFPQQSDAVRRVAVPHAHGSRLRPGNRIAGFAGSWHSRRTDPGSPHVDADVRRRAGAPERACACTRPTIATSVLDCVVHAKKKGGETILSSHP